MNPVQQTNERLTLHVIFLGTNGTGKTTMVKNHFVKPSKRRVLIIDPDGLEPQWKEYKKIDIRNRVAMQSFKGIRVAGCQSPDDIAIIEQNYNNGALVLDDFGYYTQSNIPQALRQILVRRRQKRIDIFSLTHGFTNIPPALILYTTHLCIFKTYDNPVRHKEKMNVEAFAALMETIKMVNDNPNRHYSQMVDLKKLTETPLTNAR